MKQHKSQVTFFKSSHEFSSFCFHSLQQLEDRQQATARYENRKRDVNYWLENMESRLDQLDLAPEESETVEIQIQQLRVSYEVSSDGKLIIISRRTFLLEHKDLELEKVIKYCVEPVMYIMKVCILMVNK